MIQYQTVETKQAIYCQQVLDPWVPVRYAINPYSGCEYDCNYCRVNWKKPKIVFTKKNILIKLEEELKHLRTPQLVGVGGGYNDVFAPLNEGNKLSEDLIVRLMESGHKPVIMTKNPRYALALQKDWFEFPEQVRPVIITSVAINYNSSKGDLTLEGSKVPPMNERLEVLYELGKFFSIGVHVLPMVWGGKQSTLIHEQLNKLLEKITTSTISSRSSRRPFIIWGQFKGPEANTSLALNQSLPNYQDKKVRTNQELIKQQFHRWVTEKSVKRWLGFDDCKDFLSSKDGITMLLLRYYYAQKYDGFEKQGFRYAAYQLNALTEKEFIQMFSEQRLESLPGVGEIIADIITRYVKSKNIDFFNRLVL